jgi:hypothetical protein
MNCVLSKFSKMLPLAVAQPHRSVVNSASCGLHLPLVVSVPSGSRSCSVTCDERFTGKSLKNTHNSVAVENMPHIDIDFFLSLRPRKSTPAVESVSRESPCIFLCVC